MSFKSECHFHSHDFLVLAFGVRIELFSQRAYEVKAQALKNYS